MKMRMRVCRLVAALAVLCSTADALNPFLAFSAAPAPSQKAEDLLGKAEKLAANVEGIVKANQRLLCAVGGTVLLLHGQVFSTSILFLQSFRSAGLPIMQRGYAPAIMSLCMLPLLKFLVPSLPTPSPSARVLIIVLVGIILSIIQL